MDIETIKINNNLIPYLISGYNGTNYITSYANDSLDEVELFNNFINQLLTFIENNNTLIVYAHNFSKFDGVFLLKHLVGFGKLDPLLFNGKLITIKVKLNIKGFENKTIIFKDSFLLLPHSLRDLCKAFKINEPKGVFPFKLNDINYNGVFPSFKYFKDLSLQEYLLLLNKNQNKMWIFRDESIKYCKLDCQCLYEILTKFNSLIFNEFNINIHKLLTLPALTMRIFLSKYMPTNSIYQLHGIVEKNIRQSYTGGSVDLYIPHNKIGNFIESNEYETIYQYDANALYPSVMTNDLMPVGKPIAFQGDIRKMEPDAYGFFFCKISSPKYLEHPILQRSIKTLDGKRTIAGLGTWEGWFCSTELDNALKFGYQFEILKGYQFKTANIFSKFLNRLYNLRLQYPKGDAMNLIAKLLMNSLYGKFGMHDEITRMEIHPNVSQADKEWISELFDIYNTTIIDHYDLGDFIIFIRNSITDIYYNEKDDIFHGTEVNIANASAVTASARIFMSFLKNNPDYKLYYTDTDSYFTNKPLPDYLIGNNFGQFKLENVISKAVFLAPKVYGFITTDGKEIIKVKGLNKDIKLTFNDLEALLIKDSSRVFNQEKWFKSVTKGNINIQDIIYTLKITSNKRKHIYVNEVFNSTKPYLYDEISKPKS